MRLVEPDPSEEFFDVVDAEGRPTGTVKPRADVHRDGDWHCAFHCWVVLRLESGDAAVIFQRRSAAKDTHPGKLDVAVGGHYRAGEGFDEVIREVEEELGLAPPKSELIQIGRRRAVGHGPTWIDREIEDVYVHCLTAPVEALAPACEEITALDVIRLADIECLFGNQSPAIESFRYPVRANNTLESWQMATVTLDDFIPVTDEYWLKGSRAAARVLRGETGVRLDLW